MHVAGEQLLHAMQQRYFTAATRKQAIAQSVRKDILRHPGKLYRLDQLSKKYRIDKTSLTCAFKQAYGVSIIQFLKAQRVVLAKHLLLNSGLAVKVIARDCGYKDVKHFGTMFREAVGVTPTAYRDMNWGVEYE